MVVSSGRRFPRYETVSRDTSMGVFTISNVVKADEGNYTCRPANLDAASIRLHVVNGEFCIFLCSCRLFLTSSL